MSYTINNLLNGEFAPVRSEVAEFAVAMEQKLHKHDHKTHWRDKPIEALKRLMLLEVEEFKVAHEFFDADEAMKELVDVSNYALILWDRIRIERDKAPPRLHDVDGKPAFTHRGETTALGNPAHDAEFGMKP